VKILAVNPTGQVSGAEIVLLRAVQEMTDRQWDVVVACPDGDLAGRLDRSGIRRARLDELKLPTGPAVVAAAALAARSLRASRRLRKLARNADVVLVNGFLALPALRLARLRRPTIWLVHDVIRRRSWIRLLEIVRPAITTAVAVSHAVAHPLQQHGLAVEVIPNGTPWPVPPTDGRPGDPPIVGCAAMLTSWKGQNVLLDAVAQMERRDIIVELAGGRFPKDGPYVASLEAQAAEDPLAGRVRFLGSVTDPLRQMRTWTVAVLPSVDPEAAPLSMLEAMSIGLPMVATGHGGPLEMLGDAGILVAPDDPTALAKALESLLSDPTAWDRCHAAGPQRIAQEYRLDSRIEELVNLLERAPTNPGTEGAQIPTIEPRGNDALQG
jgi:glycosyltransferase involved in cell wall biosynthesis